MVILPECCSAQTEEIQRVNMEDMERIGAKLLTLEEFAAYDASSCPSLVQEVCAAVAQDEMNPE